MSEGAICNCPGCQGHHREASLRRRIQELEMELAALRPEPTVEIGGVVMPQSHYYAVRHALATPTEPTVPSVPVDPPGWLV